MKERARQSAPDGHFAIVSYGAGFALLMAWLLFDVSRGGDPKQINGGIIYAVVFAIWFSIRRLSLKRAQSRNDQSAERS
jgi:hypothetical protein